jgi:hypothetical protein
MASPEGVINESLLPPLPGADDFSNPFFATVAHRMWESETLTDTAVAVEEVVEKLDPPQTFELAKYIDTFTDGRDANDEPAPSIWKTEFRDISINEYGLITAIVGDSRTIKRRILEGGEDFDVYYGDDVSVDVLSKLITSFEEDLFAAAAKTGGRERAVRFMIKFDKELQRRRAAQHPPLSTATQNNTSALF